MPYFRRHPPHRPDWWPDNEPWPPERRRLKFSRRLGCLLMVFNLIGFVLFWLGLTWIGANLGWIELRQPHFGDPSLGRLSLFLLFIFGIAAGSFFVMRRAAQPLDDLITASERVAQGDYTTPVPERGPREVRTLIRAFNSMLKRLHANDTRRRSLLADVSHELRTPLTIMRGNLEGMLDGIYQPTEANLRSLIEESLILERLVEDLRTLALTESGALLLHKEPTDLAVLVRETAAAIQQANSHVKIEVLSTENLPNVLVDPARLREVIVNLLTNAIKHSPQGGVVWVRCLAGQGDKILIEVQDQGRGFESADLPRVFDRFYKSADSTGMGLGLSIARDLVEAHGGTIQAANHTAGGAILRVTLPVGDTIEMIEK